MSNRNENDPLAGLAFAVRWSLLFWAIVALLFYVYQY